MVELGERAFILDGCFVREHAAVSGLNNQVNAAFGVGDTLANAQVRSSVVANLAVTRALPPSARTKALNFDSSDIRLGDGICVWALH